MTGGTPPSGRRFDVSDVVGRLHEEREALRSRASQLANDMAALIAASRDSNADDEHDPEGQTIAYERSQLSAVTMQTHDHLREVEAALERVSAGTYGTCEVCRQPIAVPRLEARPTARTCVTHVGTRRNVG
jgi:RNA polymerase-binding transcription factor DksA